MRLSDWRSRAPRRESMAPKVMEVTATVLTTLGVPTDPDCWVAWGDDPESRYQIIVPIDPGLVIVSVRVNVPGEGPRAQAKLVRWPRVQIGELTLEMQERHRIMSFHVEGHILRGVDAETDLISAFAMDMFAAIDGRPRIPAPPPKRSRRAPTKGSKAAAKPRATKGSATKASATKPSAAKAGATSAAAERAPARSSTTRPPAR